MGRNVLILSICWTLFLLAFANHSCAVETVPAIGQTDTPGELVIFSFIGSMHTAYLDGEDFGTKHHAGKEWSVQTSQQSNIWRFEVREGEARPGKDKGSERAELYHRTHYPYGTDIWISYSFKHEPNEQLGAILQAVVGQIHGTIASPPMCVRIRAGQLGFETITGTAGSSSPKPVRTLHYSTPLLIDHWYHIAIRARFDVNGQAILQVWLDGTRVVDKSNFSMGYTNASETYWKFGIYRTTSPITQAVQYANMEIGTKSLLHRVGNPLPILP